MKNFCILLFSALLLSSCGGKENPFEKLSWLQGTWKAKIEGNDVMETWTITDSTMLGHSAFLKDGKTQFTEEMSIKLEDGKLNLYTEISDQNDGEAIRFEQVFLEENKIVFGNPNHDFPQKVTYQLKNDKELSAFISGDVKGEEHRIDFEYKKVK